MNTDAATNSVTLNVNGDVRTLPSGSTLADLVELMDLAGKRFAVELNGEIISRGELAQTRVQDDDRVEIVQAIGGG